ncbi:MAG TPA: hypothetical protein PK610_12450, partial [Flavobacteriales bacterium]|nr:hypothetical protein [Flavobacteriales bacterium]
MNNQNHIQFLIENIDNACIIIDENLGIKNLNRTGKQFFEESVGINLYEENNLGDYLSAVSKKKLKKL